jgi:hypothetical protein
VFEGGPWTNGNFTAALILDANATEEQRSALARALGGELGGDAGGLAQLIGDMKGVFVAPIDYRHEDGEVEVRAGDLAAGAGATPQERRRQRRDRGHQRLLPDPEPAGGQVVAGHDQCRGPVVRPRRQWHVDGALRAQRLSGTA